MVHPPSSRRLWEQGTAGAAAGLVATAAAPDEGMAMRVPVPGRRVHGLREFVPTLEPSSLERQRAQNLPPGLDQIEVRRILGLEDELPAGMGQGEQQHIG